MRKCIMKGRIRFCKPCPEGYDNDGETGCKKIDLCSGNGKCSSMRECLVINGKPFCGPCPDGF